MDEALLQLLPIGEENAVSARWIWGVERLWSPATFKTKLNQLANEGLIERKVIARGQNRQVLYFRKEAS